MASRQLRRRSTASLSIGLLSTILATGTAMAMGTLAVVTLSNSTGRTDAATFTTVFGPDTGRRSGPVSPSPLSADKDVPGRGDCFLQDQLTAPPNCFVGDPTGMPVVLFGDSHAQQWQPAVAALATIHHWKVYLRVKAGCPVPNIPPRNDGGLLSQPGCEQWRQATISEITTTLKPKLIFVSSLGIYSGDAHEMLTDWNSSLDLLRSASARIVYIRDTPYPNKDIPACISSSLDNWDHCDFERDAVPRTEPVITEAVRGNEPDVTVVDLDAYLCDSVTCPAVRNGVLLYRDHSHITATASSLLAPAMDRELAAAGLITAGPG
jgi:hypothetical protein